VTMEKTLSFLVLFAPPPLRFCCLCHPFPRCFSFAFPFLSLRFCAKKELVSEKEKGKRKRERNKRERERLEQKVDFTFPPRFYPLDAGFFSLSSPSSLFPFLITMSGAVTRRPAAAAAKAPRE